MKRPPILRMELRIVNGAPVVRIVRDFPPSLPAALKAGKDSK